MGVVCDDKNGDKRTERRQSVDRKWLIDSGARSHYMYKECGKVQLAQLARQTYQDKDWERGRKRGCGSVDEGQHRTCPDLDVESDLLLRDVVFHEHAKNLTDISTAWRNYSLVYDYISTAAMNDTIGLPRVSQNTERNDKALDTTSE